MNMCPEKRTHDKILLSGTGVCGWCGADYAEILFPGYVTNGDDLVCQEELEDDESAMWDDAVKVIENHR